MDNAMGYYSAIERNKLLIYGNNWMNFKNTLSERSQTQKATYSIIHFTLGVGKRLQKGMGEFWG